jgi:hypothetical protein
MYKFYSECCVLFYSNVQIQTSVELRDAVTSTCTSAVKKSWKWHLSCVVDADLLSAEQAVVDSRVFKAQDS